MEGAKKVEVPERLILTSFLSAGTVIALSLAYIVLALLGVIYRFDCDVTSSESTRGDNHFMNMIHRVYIQTSSCEDSMPWEDVTSSEAVFILNIITICVSVVTLIAASVLIAVVRTPEYVHHVKVTVYVYICACVASLLVDLTFACHFGMDYTYISNLLNLSSPGVSLNYNMDMVRLGALLFMIVSLKAFVPHVINIVLMILMIVYVANMEQPARKEEHAIHKLGALNAYDRPRRQDPWQQEPPMFLNPNRGANSNPAFEDDSPPRSPRRDRSYTNQNSNMSDYSNSRGINRSESWQASAMSGARPFSYLEEAKRAPPPVEPQWRRDPRDWQPPLPAPDYSPQTPRRLKSALKPY